MGKNCTYGLVGCVALVLLGGLGVVGIGFLGMKQAGVKIGGDGSVGQEIVSHTVPAGYRQMMGVDNDAVRHVMYGPEKLSSGEPLIIQIMEFKAGAAPAAGQPAGAATTLGPTAESRPVHVNGQATQLKWEDKQDNGKAQRTAVVEFEGLAGKSVIIIAGSPTAWDWALVDSFLASTNPAEAVDEEPADEPTTAGDEAPPAS